MNSRKSQIIATLIPIALAGMILAVPFVWRALRTKARADVKVAIASGVMQVAVWSAYAFDPSDRADRVSNVTGAVVWFCAFAAAAAAAWVFRPLNKEEQMDQARSEHRPGSTYL